MKIKKGLVLSEVGEDYVVVPVGDQYQNFKGVVQLNHSGAEIWKCLEQGLSRDEAADHLLEVYTGVDRETALRSVDKVIGILQNEGFLE